MFKIFWIYLFKNSLLKVLFLPYLNVFLANSDFILEDSVPPILTVLLSKLLTILLWKTNLHPFVFDTWYTIRMPLSKSLWGVLFFPTHFSVIMAFGWVPVYTVYFILESSCAHTSPLLLARTAITQYHTLADSNNRNLFSHRKIIFWRLKVQYQGMDKVCFF